MNTDSKTDNPDDFVPEHVVRHLTRAAQRLDDNTVVSLQRARNMALDKLPLSQPVYSLSVVRGWLSPHSMHQRVATIILLLAMLFGGLSYWQHMHESELSHLDAAILSDELPLEVFVD